MEFNFNDVEVGNDYGLVEKGRYDVLVSDAKWVPNKSGTGEYVKIEFTIVSEKFNGRKIWGIYNLIHNNPTAVSIAKKEIKSILTSLSTDGKTLNKVTKSDLIEIITGKIVEAQIFIKPGIGGYEPSNGIRNFMPASQSPNDTVQNDEIPF